jgi:outer membrane receptor for ferrienterochelin and colicin
MFRQLGAVAAAVVTLLVGASRTEAQSVTTGAIGGLVTDSAGRPMAGVQIQVVNRETGFRTAVVTRSNGRYITPSLEVGGPYSVSARAIGYAPQQVNDIFVALSQTSPVNFQMANRAVQLARIAVTSTRQELEFGPSRQGTQTRISDSAIARLPNINRNISDFVRLTPQVAVTSGGRASPAGQNNRFLSVQIDGASIANRFGLGDSPEVGAQAGGRSITQEAIKEYQVIISPFDVRQGNFTGALVNAVTKGGTNKFQGSLFFYQRDQNDGANVPLLRSVPFYREQWGGSLSGPIIKDRLHFFATLEYQRQSSPASGLYLGQPANVTPPFPSGVTAAQVDSFTTRWNSQFNNQPVGSLGLVTNRSPLANSFVRFDYRINDNHRLVVRNVYNDQQQDDFSRGNVANNPLLSFTSTGFTRREISNNAVAQLFSSFKNGATNEFIFGYTRTRFRREIPVRTPMVVVQNVGGPNVASLRAGTENSSQGNFLEEDLFELTNNFTIPLGAKHRLTIGTRNELYNVTNGFLQNSFGNWTFVSMADWVAGNTSGPTLSTGLNLPAGTTGALYTGAGPVQAGANVLAQFTAGQAGVYVQDVWEVTPRLTVNMGLRADAPFFLDTPGNQARVDSAFRANPAGNEFANGLRTDVMPNWNWQISPRVGFNWDITGNSLNQLRGGIGIFQGSPAYVWMSNQYQNSGVGLGQISCGGGNTNAFGAAPAWSNSATAVTTCGQRTGGLPGLALGTTTVGTVNVADANLRFPQVWRATLAYDRKLPLDLIATLEGYYSGSINDLFYTDANLRIPSDTARDVNGRVLYGALATTGLATPGIVTSLVPRAIRISNQSANYQYGVTAQLRKVFSYGWEGTAAYTYQRSFSVSDLTSSVALSNWQFGRVYSGLQTARNVDVSAFDQPHRVLLAGTWTTPVKSAPTAISLIYSWQSGTPFAYIAGGAGGRGDLNGDGSNANDPIYIPTNARDPQQMQFQSLNVGGVVYTPAQQAEAFDRFIAGDECLNEQRGRIMQRNSCRNPSFATLDLAVRQSLPKWFGQNLALEFQVFNFLNALNPDWGKVRSAGANPQVTLVNHVANTNTGNLRTSQPVYTFDPNNLVNRYPTLNNVGGFWRSQIGLRYSF